MVELTSPLCFTASAPLILASGSPRRKQYFDELGLEYTIEVADVDEQLRAQEAPEQFVKRLSLDKAQTVAKNNKTGWVIGADTVVVLGEQILGKPVDNEDALLMLQMLRGKWHEVWTGFTICNVQQNITIQNTVKTGVKFWHPPTDLLKSYVATGEPQDKAGAYGIQGKGGFLVQEIKGSYSNVVGFPMVEIIKVLLDLEVIKA
jgi:septum formation protein